MHTKLWRKALRGLGTAALALALALGGGGGCVCAGGPGTSDSGDGGGGGGGDGGDAGSGTDTSTGGTDAVPNGIDSATMMGTDASGPGTDSTVAVTDAGPMCDPTFVSGCTSTEVCGNGLDDDCDGTADEWCICTTVGATQPCFNADPGYAGVGACTFGTQTCSTGLGEFPYWDLCAGAALPTAEVCDGVDNDCNGCTDEGGVCGSADPIAVCPADITANTLDTVAWTGSGSDDGTIVGYTWSIVSSPATSSSALGATTGTSSDLFLDVAGDWTIEFCVTDDTGLTDCCTFVVHSVPGEIFRVELTWDIDDDLDLHLAHLPTATYWNVGVMTLSDSDCMWANCTGPGLDWDATTASGGPPYMTPDDDPHLDIDSGFPVPAMGPENINIDGPNEIGYRIAVHYYDGNGPPNDAVATVNVYCNGVVVHTDTQALTSGNGPTAPFTMNDFWVVADVTLSIDPMTSLYVCTVSPIDMVHTSTWAGSNL